MKYEFDFLCSIGLLIASSVSSSSTDVIKENIHDMSLTPYKIGNVRDKSASAGNIDDKDSQVSETSQDVKNEDDLVKIRKLTSHNGVVNLCAPYVATNTLYARQNIGICYIEVCPGDMIIISTDRIYPGAVCGDGETDNDSYATNYDTYLRLVDHEGILVAENDEINSFTAASSSCSGINYTVPWTNSQCYVYELWEGCYETTTCSATVYVENAVVIGAAPTVDPTFKPTIYPTAASTTTPSIKPTSTPTIRPTFKPTTLPSSAKQRANPTAKQTSTSKSTSISHNGVVNLCAPYSGITTWYAHQFHDICYIDACPGDTIIISTDTSYPGAVCGLDAEGNNATSFRLIDQNGNQVAENLDLYTPHCAGITYTVPKSNSQCYVYELWEGCFYLYECAATVYVANAVVIHKSPTLISHSGGENLCAPYNAFNTDSAQHGYSVCYIEACPGDNIIISTDRIYPGAICGDNVQYEEYVDTYLRLFDHEGNQVAENDDLSSSTATTSGLCSGITYTVPTSFLQCYVYELHEGCSDNLLCEGTVYVEYSSVVENSSNGNGNASNSLAYVIAPCIIGGLIILCLAYGICRMLFTKGLYGSISALYANTCKIYNRNQTRVSSQPSLNTSFHDNDTDHIPVAYASAPALPIAILCDKEYCNNDIKNIGQGNFSQSVIFNHNNEYL